MNTTVSKSTDRFTGRYTFRFPITYIILTIGSLLFILYDFTNHIFISIDYFLIIGIIYYIYTLIVYGGKRSVTFRNQGMYFNNKPVNQRIKDVRRLDENHLEIRFNILWIMIIQAEEQDIDKLIQAFHQLN